MRILFVTRDDPYGALTGVATYVRDLAEALGKRSHEIAHLHVSPGPWWTRPRLRWTRRGSVLTGVVTVPAVSRTEEERLRADVTWSEVEQVLTRALGTIRPAVVHIHDLSGVPAELVPTAQDAGVPVVVTMHDFWPFCRQFLLVRRGLVPCPGSDGGRNCAKYCAAQPVSAARRFAQWADQALPGGVRDGARWALGLYRRRSGGSGSQFVVVNGPSSDGVPDEHLVDAYAKRETRMRHALLRADRLLTVSESAKTVYVRHGYPEQRIHVLPLALRVTEQVRRRVREFTGYPVRFGYLGRVNPWKGAHLLAEAVRGIPAPRAQFTFYGAVTDEDRSYLTTLSGRHPGLHFVGRYTRGDLIRILDEIDVAVFPSVMTETLGLVGLEAQAAGIPIVGAAHGAITEYVKDDTNGLLFPPGDVEALRARILRVVEHPDLIARLSSGTSAPRHMAEHVRAVEAAYEDVVRTWRRAAAAADQSTSVTSLAVASGSQSEAQEDARA